MWKASSHYTLWRVVHDNSANQIAAFPFLYLPSVILRILDRDLLIVLPMREPSQPRSQGPLSTSRKYPGCGWSRVYVNKSNPHRGWIIDLILSTLSMEVKVALLLYLES